MGEEGLNTSFLSLQRTLQLLNHSAFSCLEKSVFPEADADRLEQFCCHMPFHMFGPSCFKSNSSFNSD